MTPLASWLLLLTVLAAGVPVALGLCRLIRALTPDLQHANDPVLRLDSKSRVVAKPSRDWSS